MRVRTLLDAGIVASVLFVVVLLVQGATRPGYSAWRNYGSSLSLGDGGWVQIANFLIAGVLFGAFAVGLLRVRMRAVGILIGLFALMLVVAGLFVTDPGLGYPPGAPAGQVGPTPHGAIHALSGLFVFIFSTLAAIVAAVQAARRGQWRWSLVSTVVAVIIAGFFASQVAANADERTAVPGLEGLYQRVFIVGAWAWIALLAYRVRSTKVG